MEEGERRWFRQWCRRICLAILVAWWSLMILHEPWSAAQAQEVTKPVAANAKAESQAGEIDEDKKLAAELAGLREKLKTAGEALEAKKKTLAPRIRETQNHVQQLSAALQKAVGPDASTALEGGAAPRSGSAVTAGA